MNRHIDRSGELGRWGKGGRRFVKVSLAKIVGGMRTISAFPNQPRHIPINIIPSEPFAVAVYTDRQTEKVELPRATMAQVVAIDALSRRQDLHGLDAQSHRVHPYAPSFIRR